MRILIACEFSGIVRDAFIAQGHDAWSCDLIPTERPGPHIVNDVRNVLSDGWDMMIGHPPCKYLSYAGARWFKLPGRMEQTKEAIRFFMALWSADIPMIALENPRGFSWKWFRKPDQVIDPSHFGHSVTKSTGLWLKNLPPLMATMICAAPFRDWTTLAIFGENKARARSRTFPGIAHAMATQWGRF